MGTFLNERFPIDINYGSSLGHHHNVDLMTTQNGAEYRALNHPFVKLEYNVIYEQKLEKVANQVMALYDRANGKFRSFRVKDLSDYTSNGYRDVPTMLDQACIRIAPSGRTYQLTKWYGDHTDPLCARRLVKKPVSGTVVVAYDGVAVVAGVDYNLDESTGIITNIQGGAGGETLPVYAIIDGGTVYPGQCVVGVMSNTFEVGDILTFADVVGMTEINGLSGAVTIATPDAVAVAINTTGFSAYISGGTVTKGTPTPEPALITAGFEFDVPCRFDADFKGSFPSWEQLTVSGLPIVEVFNP